MENRLLPTQVITGNIPSPVHSGWNQVINQFGTGFQSVEWCQAFSQGWQGIFSPEHVTVCAGDQVVAVIPAYRYEQCSRVDYYRQAIQTHVITDPILMSHALVGWYGFPIAAYPAALEQAISAFIERALQLGGLAWFAGIDERDHTVLTTLERQGFALCPFHTVMIRSLDAVTTPHGLEVLSHARQRAIRELMRRAERAGTTTRLATPVDNPAIIELIEGVLRQKDILPDVLPRSFTEQLLIHHIPGLEAIVAVNQGRIVGVNINLHWGKTYALCLGGHDRTTLKLYYQSHLLYEAGVQRALELGCHEIQAGRSPYPIKIKHGYSPIRVWCAVRGTTPEKHEHATKWIKSLEQRHYTLYPEVAHL